jgi:K+-transporting ATPase A subunit
MKSKKTVLCFIVVLLVILYQVLGVFIIEPVDNLNTCVITVYFRLNTQLLFISNTNWKFYEVIEPLWNTVKNKEIFTISYIINNGSLSCIKTSSLLW